jgi:hypothetical protein
MRLNGTKVARKDSEKKFLDEVEHEFGRIVEDPFLFPKADETNTIYRRAVLKKFPFIIIFSSTKNAIIIHSVFHTRLNPNKKPSA